MMNKLKINSMFFMFFLLQYSVSCAQNKTPIVTTKNVQNLLSQLAKYPVEGVEKKASCQQVFEITIDVDGRLSNVVNRSDCPDYFKNAALAGIAMLANSKWILDAQENDTFPIKKLLVVNFNARDSSVSLENVLRLIKNKKFKRALKVSSRTIKKDPYNLQMLQFQSLIYQEMGEDEKGKLNWAKIESLTESLYGSVSVPLVDFSVRQLGFVKKKCVNGTEVYCLTYE